MNMRPKLLILSDMFGLDRCEWIKQYVALLDPIFTIQLYDSCALGDVRVADAAEDDIHAAFIAGGVDTAADKLSKMELGKVDILAFSMGGSIAWKAGSKGMHIGHLYAISSTRLRLQTEKPDCRVQLFYGKVDPFHPKPSWFEKLKLDPPLMENGGHDFYTGHDVAIRICSMIRSIHHGPMRGTKCPL